MTTAPPQDSRVALSHSQSGDAGRFAVAATDISPGDAVLIAAPYLFVFNPTEFSSGLYLAARAVTPSTEGYSSGAAAGAGLKGQSNKKKTTRAKKGGDDMGESAPTTTMIGDVASLCHCISHRTRCSECFCDIAAGTVMDNYHAIKALGIDISVEQETVLARLREQQLQHQQEQIEVEGSSEDAEEVVSAVAAKKQKKPTRSAKMRSDGAVELKNRLHEMALAQREAIIYEHKLAKKTERNETAQKQRLPASASALPRCWREEAEGGCEEEVEGAGDGGVRSSTSTPVPPLSSSRCHPQRHGFAVCEGCGVVAYCSPRCWTEGHARHVKTGECGVLRWLYPHLMREYFSVSGSGGRGGGGREKPGGGKGAKKKQVGGGGSAPTVSVVMPGDEPLHWARNASEEKSVEAQCMLLVSLLLAESGSDRRDSSSAGGDFGTASHWGLATTETEAKSLANVEGTTHEDNKAKEAEKDKSPQSVAGDRSAAARSQLFPKEVLAMQDTRIRLGVSGKVEVMDADSAGLGEVATSTDADPLCEVPQLTHRILVRRAGSDDGSDRMDEHGSARLLLSASLSEADEAGTYHHAAQQQEQQGVATEHAEEGDAERAKNNYVRSQSESTTGAAPSLATQKQLVRVPCYADMAAMVTNLSVLSRERRACYARYYRRFLKNFLPWLMAVVQHQSGQSCRGGEEMPEEGEVLLFPRGSNGEAYFLHHAAAIGQRYRGSADNGTTTTSSEADTGDETASPLAALPLEAVVAEAYFTRICAAAQCNSFGVYTREDRQIAFGAYPEASYFNHSCLPNLCRVMGKGGRAAAFYALRPIAKGDALTICYTDVEETNTAERRRNLLDTYRFFCTCERCSGLGGAEAARQDAVGAKTEKGCPLYLCKACPIRGYLRPLAPSGCVNAEPPGAWGWDRIAERQCTMCGTHYPFSP